MNSTLTQNQYKSWLIDNASSWSIAGTIRSSYTLTTTKLEKYCRLILRYNPDIRQILYVIELDSDPYSDETDQICHYTRKIVLGTHAHLLVDTASRFVDKPLPNSVQRNQPFFIPFWKKMHPGEVKNYVKYNLPKMKKDGSNWGLVLQEVLQE